MTTYTWTLTTSGSSGAWSGSNWTPSGPPATGSAVTIGNSTLTGAITISEDTTVTINSLTLIGHTGTKVPTLTFTGGSVLTVSTTVAITTAIINGNGELIDNATSGGITGSGVASIAAGTASAGGTFELAGTGTISGVSFTINSFAASTLNLALTAGVSVSGIGITSANQKLEISAGTLTETAGQAYTNGTVQLAGGTLTDAAGISFSSGATLTGFGTFNPAITGSGGNIIASGGTLRLAGGAATGQSYSIATGSASDLRLGSGTYTLGSAVTLNNSNQTLEIGSTGTVTINAGQAISAGVLQLDGGSLTDSSGLVVNGGTVTGMGTIVAAITAGTGGTVLASGGTLALAGAIGASQATAFDIANSATSVLQLGTSVGASIGTGNTFNFLGSAGVLAYDATTGFKDSITQLNVGTSNTTPTNDIDFLNQTGFTISGGIGGGNAFTGSSATVTLTSGGVTNTLTLSSLTGSTGGTWYVDAVSDGGSGTKVFLSTQVCYAAGTRILTATGERMVESLQPGDIVLTLAGQTIETYPIKWIGHRRLDLTTHPRPTAVAPIRIQRGAFADAMPHSDLLVSPDHAILVDGGLICARQLVNGTTIRQETDWTSVEYFHVELESHAILLAEGLPAESYLDTGNRGFFANSGAPLALHPDLTDESDYPTRAAASCAPFVSDAAGVQPVWQRLAARAVALGQPAPQHATTLDADLCIVAKGRQLRPLYGENGLYVFALPKGATEVRMISRASAPTDTQPWLEDRRLLGVYVTRIVLRGANEVREVPVDHPDLARGWWAVERDGTALCRWTNGDATLALPTFEHPAMLEIHASNCGMSYLTETDARLGRRAA